ncbi:MAG TPA: 30S ribosome-binding factor RbfA [Williamwhitmania sp.]|jgi:ribosome-binding factor A|nr:30S ribosome-binding factor RbfA [Williamwhitmania sp.]
MTSTRQEKVARQLQRDLGEIIQKEGQALFFGKMVTVTSVRVSPDLSFAKTFLSIFPSNDKDATLALIRTHTKQIRHELGKRVKNQLRIVPELAFFIDDSLDYIENIENLLKE